MVNYNKMGYQCDMVIGTLLNNPFNTITETSLAMNQSYLRWAFSFPVFQDCTLTSVRIKLVSGAGTMTYGDIQISICPFGSDGYPDYSTILASTTETDTDSYVVNAWNTFDNFSVNLSAGHYAIVIQNNAASPSTTYYKPAVHRNLGKVCGDYDGLGVSGFGHHYFQSTNSGTSWVAKNQMGAYFRLGFSDGTFDGSPISTAQATVKAIIGDDMGGAKFHTPKEARLFLQQVVIGVLKTGTPTTNLTAKLYKGTTLIATSPTSIPPAILQTGKSQNFIFRELLDADTDYRIVLARTDSNSDTTSNKYDCQYLQFESDSIGKIPNFMQDSLIATSYDSATATWTDDDDYIPAIYLNMGLYVPCFGVTRAEAH